MRLQPVDLDDQLILGLHDAYVAGSADDPGPKLSLAHFRHAVCTDAPGERNEAWVAVEEGEVAGGYALSFPQLDNTHMGWIFPLSVRPERRGHGLGSRLFEHALDRMRAHGRRLLLTETPVTGVGSRFARAHGMTVSLVEARRTLDLRRADWAALERLLPRVEGYSLERWTGPADPALLPDLATLMGGMNDAPRDADLEDAHFTTERLRAREQDIPLTGRTCYTTIARRDQDGAPAGYTRVYLEADRSDGWGSQADTMVLSEHRGHRLGLLLKLSNLLWLRESEPHLERIITWNATSNGPMLAINEAMGFELFDEWNEWRLEDKRA
ncbi:GNAT family N-acetyltransferase [Nonomuraea jiangxiensis]|uniref:Acetyltransferase (GNAT) family protein n=1 Tax=Nonomuraea jiangxiensis TaxID=633440 RepID=A0A1G7YKX2_9ACTN|nr:GNAT family N-acetyltransferase [Nonomuraea jiangxiensis]SDG97044.1 Acetyltransferase (GNAT) family protein [Nonomuraea jiangxiensis]